MALSGRHRKTLEAIYQDPIRANLPWVAVERLLLALGAELSEGHGSRVRIALGGIRAVFHRPHPRKEIGKGALRSMRSFLRTAGIEPED